MSIISLHSSRSYGLAYFLKYIVYIVSLEAATNINAEMKNTELISSLETKLEKLIDVKFEEIKDQLKNISEGVSIFKEQINKINEDIISIKQKAHDDKDDMRNEMGRIISNLNEMFVTRIGNEVDIKEMITKTSGIENPNFVVIKWFEIFKCPHGHDRPSAEKLLCSAKT